MRRRPCRKTARFGREAAAAGPAATGGHGNNCRPMRPIGYMRAIVGPGTRTEDFMRATRALVWLAALAAIGPWPVAAATPSAGIQAHRALYKVSLARATSASEIIDVRGRMGFEWRDDCDGWAIE